MKADLKALKMRVDLAAVIAAHGVPLKQKGANLVAPCPFPPHREKTASFTVSPAKRIWKCFGCGRGGDVFKFLELKANLTLPQAIEWLQAFVGQAEAAAPADGAAVTMAPIDARPVDRPPQAVLDRVIALWQKALANAAKAQSYLKARALWRPELVRALRIGYASGSLPRTLPGGGKLRRQLTQMGILNDRGNEFFYRRIVIPIFDEAGVLVNVYGRAIDPDNECKHLYLAGAQRGVFNRPGVAGAQDVILTEAPLDAISLLALGFTQVASSYGANVFPADLRQELVRGKTRRVYCVYDPDPAGDQAADQLAHDLATHGIEVLRVALPQGCKDPNDFLRGGGSRDQFQALLDAARPIGAPRPAPLTPAPVTTPAPAPAVTTSPTTPAPAPAPAPVPGGAIAMVRGPRTYEVLVLPGDNPLSLRVRLKVRHAGRAFVDNLNLYSDRARGTAVARLVRVFGPGTSRDQVEADVFSVMEELEERARSAAAPAGAAAAADAMPEPDRAVAMAFLTTPDLVRQIRDDLAELGVVGEDRSKLLVYLVATSRRLGRPLSLCVVSRSSAGKSFLVSKTSELIPEDELLAYTRMSSKALFHDESERLKHKLLTIEEAQGMEEAAYALRVMQSNQMLRNLSTITDPATGKHKASENVVHGPVALIVTTTTELDFETVSRAFVISVDESIEQTERIHHMQRSLRTLEGLGAKVKAAAIVAKHRNAQRLLKPLAVVNPYAPHLTFPSGTLRLRREQDKYLTLIEAITYLFQYQREQGVYSTPDGQTIPYVLTAPADIDLANELVVASLRQAFEEVTTPSRELLRLIRKMVNDPDRTGDARFSRRALREYTGWSDYQIRIHLKQLEELEYVAAVTGSFGKEYVYTLTPDHRLALDGEGTLADEVRELGLTSGADLAKPKKQ